MDEHAARRLRGFAEAAGRGLRGLDAAIWRERMERRYRELLSPGRANRVIHWAAA